MGSPSCFIPQNTWVLKSQLSLDWAEAKEAFSEVYKSPYNPKFYSNSDKKSQFKIISETEYMASLK